MAEGGAGPGWGGVWTGSACQDQALAKETGVVGALGPCLRGLGYSGSEGARGVGLRRGRCTMPCLGLGKGGSGSGRQGRLAGCNPHSWRYRV